MDAQEHLMQAARTVRYYQQGQPGPHIRQVWWVYHGYGMLAQYFIRKFAHLTAAGNVLVVAPEGMSRFYMEGYERVGATWATKDLRDHDVADHVAWLGQLQAGIAAQLPADCQHIHFGFSQGASVAWRVLDRTEVPAHWLVAWAGLIPEEYNRIHSRSGLQAIACAGTEDPLLTDERMDKFFELMERSRLPLHRVTYPGAHVVDAAALAEVVRLIGS